MVETKGRKLGGFLLTTLLGQGAMGAVYRGKQLSLDRDVAVKVILPTYADNPDYIRRFEREAKLIAQLTHQNITQIYEFGTFDGYYLIVMEFVEGTSLKGLLSSEKKLPVYAVCEMMAQIGSGLAAGASKSIVHRDIKPENIQISKGGVCKILDFGLAKDESGNAQMTMAGGILGTPSFMSPEQCQGKAVDYRADTYGLGTSAYYLLTGEVPYKADSQLAVLNMHCNAPIPDPRVLRPDIPEDLALYVMKLMSKKPEDRCKNASQVVRDLEEILHGMKDRKALSELSQTWDWGKMIVLPESDGTSLLDNYAGQNRNTDRTIVSGTMGGRTAQQSSFNQETIVSGSSTNLQTRGETIGQTQHAQTQQYGQTMLPGQSVTNNTRMDATLLPGGGSMTQTFGGTQSATIMDQKKNSSKLFIGVAVVVIIGLALFFGSKSGKKDWAPLEKDIASIRDQIDLKDNYSGVDFVKSLIEKNSDYPKKDLILNEVKTWEKNREALKSYNAILDQTALGNYQAAEELSVKFQKNHGDSKYWEKIREAKANWRDYAIAVTMVNEALSLAKAYNYEEALSKLDDVQYRYKTYEPIKIAGYIETFKRESRLKKQGELKGEVERAKALTKSKDYLQASILVKEIMKKGNESEKSSIKNELEQIVSDFKTNIDKKLSLKELNVNSEEIKFIQEFNKKEQEPWIAGYQKKVNDLIGEYNSLKKQANESFAQKNFDGALTQIETARKIQKPAEDEAEYLEFLLKIYIAKGDQLFADKKYNEAYSTYKLGEKIRKDDPEIAKKLTETDKKIKESQKSADTDKEFADAMSKGDALFNRKEYVDANLSYKGALSIRPNDKNAEEKVRVSGFYSDSKQIEKDLSSKDDNIDLVEKKLEDLKKLVVAEEEKKTLSDLQSKHLNKKCNILRVETEKAIIAKSFKEAVSYLKQYKSIQSSDDAELKKIIEHFKTQAIKASDEMVTKSFFTQGYQLLELIKEIAPDSAIQSKMDKIKKSKDEEASRLENAEKLNSLVSEATIAYEKKQFNKALELIEKAFAMDSKNVDVIRIRKNSGFEHYSYLGKNANDEAKFELAIVNFKKALEYDPDRPATKAILEKLERPKAEVVLIDTLSKASLQQKAWAASLGLPLEKKVLISGVSFEFVLIPPGKFKLGQEEGGDSDETPVREITISNPFYLLKNEVTNEQYHVYNASEESFSKDKKEPVLGIVYSKQLGFCKFLGANPEISSTVRNPTEAEWEFACRSGSKGDFSFGNNLPELSDYAYFKDNAGTVKKVMQLKPNAFGLYDMHGNAFEMCRDFYHNKAYSITNQTDPYYDAESDQVNKKVKVIRGGDFDSTPANLRSANRVSRAHAQRELLKTVGFRVLMEINQK